LNRLRRQLKRWYRLRRRDLPWRRSRDPYKIWVSEVLLQQTQVATALPYYRRFLRRFPTVGVLASAPLEAVLQAWSGLGYYRRARYLHAAAAQIVHQHEGQFPRQWAAARALPGVGEYTAAAVLSIAYRVPRAVVDGNVRRVMARLVAQRPGSPARARRRIEALAQALLDRRDPGESNQALMELGALICLPARPLCAACPLRRDCRGFASGRPERFPAPRSRKAVQKIDVGVALIERDGALLWHRRSDQAGLLAGLWELPHARLAPREPKARAALEAALKRRYDLDLTLGAALAPVRHAITFRSLTLRGFRARLARPPRPRGVNWRWVKADQAPQLARSSAWSKLVSQLLI